MSGQTLIALITAVASLVVSVVTAAISSSFRRRSETELAKLENQLIEEQSGRAARRAYVYDARKQLYTEFQPVLFQMMERCGGAVSHEEAVVIPFEDARSFLTKRMGMDPTGYR